MSDALKRCCVTIGGLQCVLSGDHVGFHRTPDVDGARHLALSDRLSALASQAFGYQGSDPIGALELGVVRLQAENKLALGEISRMTMRPAAEVLEAERVRMGLLDRITTERDSYRAMVCDLLASAVPNGRDHLTMSKQWARARELLKNGPRAEELWAACEEPPDGDGVPACGWTGEMSQLVIYPNTNGVTHCPMCGSTAIKEDITR